MKKTVSLFILGLAMIVTPLFSQSSSFSVGELDPYFSEYVKPVAIGLAAGMGSGWAHEARPHKTLGFDLSFSVVGVQVPTEALNFSSSSLESMIGNDYTFMEGGNDITGTDFLLPTMASKESTDVDMIKNFDTSVGSASLKIPAFDGLNVSFAPSASLQLAIGLPKGTEIIGRYVPEMGETINDYSGLDELKVNKMNMWGIGVKHDLKQWIPVVSRVPLLEISALLAYSEFNFDMTSTSISFTPDDLIPDDVPWGNDFTDPEIDPNTVYDNQGFAMAMTSISGALLVGLNIPVVRPFIGVGFNRASVTTGLTGYYPVIEVNDDFDPIAGTADDNSSYLLLAKDPEKNPLYLDAEKTFVNFQAGINVKIAILTLHAQYTYQEYSMYSAGIALGFR